MLSFKSVTSYIVQNKKAHLQGIFQASFSRVHSGKRAVLSVFCSAKKAALTIEAALILPPFLIAMLFLLGFGQVMQTELSLIGPLHQTGRRLARDAYAYDEIGNAVKMDGIAAGLLQGGLSVLAAKNSFVNDVGKSRLEACGIAGGADGISFLFSKVPDEEDMIDLVMTYRICLPLKFIPVPDIPVTQRCRVHSWTGFKPEAREDVQMVYVADSGTVYHLSASCTHLALSIRQVRLSQTAGMRNASGGRYYPCESCGKDCGEYVYITSSGNRYHSAVSCSGLKRGIRKVPITEVGDMPLCSRCRENTE